MRLIAAVGIFLWISAASGCGGKSTPEPLPVNDIPSAIEQAFEAAPDDIRNPATRIAEAIRIGDYQFAYHHLQLLAQRTDLSKEQASVLKRAMLTVAN